MNYVTMSRNCETRKQVRSCTYLIIWFNIEIYFALVEGILGASSISALFRYSLYLIFLFLVILKNNWLIKKKITTFVLFFLVLVIVNVILVSWKKYVLTEALCALIIALPVFVVFSNTKINLELCLKCWYPYCQLNTFLLFFALYLYKKNYISYGVISTIVYTNVIILWLLYIKKIKHNWFDFLIILVNLCISIIWGSRMPSLAALITMTFMWIFMSGKSKVCKLFFFILIAILCFFTIYFLENLIDFVTYFLLKFHLSSRSLEIFLTDLKNGDNLLQMLESSGRESIWNTVFTFLKSNFILPRGFGFVRHLTNGKYYYSHNILSDVLIMGGITSLLFVLLFIVKLYEYKKRVPQLYWDFLCSFLLFFLIRSITGAYFISDKYFVFVVGLLFFSKKDYDEI